MVRFNISNAPRWLIWSYVHNALLIVLMLSYIPVEKSVDVPLVEATEAKSLNHYTPRSPPKAAAIIYFIVHAHQVEFGPAIHAKF